MTRHLDEMIANGYRGDFREGPGVTEATREHERNAVTTQTGLRPNISWGFRVRTKIKMAHTPRKAGEALTHSNIHAVY